MITQAEASAVARRVRHNLRRADLDPAGNCFLAARAMQILLNEGEIVEGHCNGDSHHWYGVEVDGEALYFDPTADGVGADVPRGLAGFPATSAPEYDGLSRDWPASHSVEFAVDLVALVRPLVGD